MTLSNIFAEEASTDDKIRILKVKTDAWFHRFFLSNTFSTNKDRLLDTKQPLAKRMRVVCSLRAVRGHGTVEALASCLNDESALLRHEVAYALGQKEEKDAVPVLIDTLRWDKDAMVRHEAAEALGAIGAEEGVAVLEEFEHSEVEEVAHTCQLALDRIRWNSKRKSDTGKEFLYISIM